MITKITLMAAAAVLTAQMAFAQEARQPNAETGGGVGEPTKASADCIFANKGEKGEICNMMLPAGSKRKAAAGCNETGTVSKKSTKHID